VSEASFLHAYLKTLDTEALDILPMLAPGFTFSVLWTDETGAREFAGSLEEFHGYLAQRDADGQLHHIVASSRRDRLEVALGYTTRYGEPLATFTMAAQLDAEGRAERLFAARTTSLPLGPVSA
jgi:hypothetical protein